MFDPARIQHVYIACGYTDLRLGIDGLVSIVQTNFQLDPFANALFLFCGRRADHKPSRNWA
ncbi:MAG: IS66 family insertion sequence element accessory protein TnpB [Christensenellales bacterium]